MSNRRNLSDLEASPFVTPTNSDVAFQTPGGQCWDLWLGFPAAPASLIEVKVRTEFGPN